MMIKSVAKNERDKKKQLGQFITPFPLTKEIIDRYSFNREDIVLEPSFGTGNFIISLIYKFLPLYGNDNEKVPEILINNIYGVEYDKQLFYECIHNIEHEFSVELEEDKINLYNTDFFKVNFSKGQFDYVIGNPPFGGTLDREIEDKLDKSYGKRLGLKIKKETYSFFLIKSIEELKNKGSLEFICSNTFLTINTMKGLRNYLMQSGFSSVKDLNYFSKETEYGMLILSFSKGEKSDYIEYNDAFIYYSTIQMTDNFSWNINEEDIFYFSGSKLKDYLDCSSGMTIGKNELFLREIIDNSYIIEPYEFSFYQKRITLEEETANARLNKLSKEKTEKIRTQEANGETKEDVEIKEREEPLKVHLPDPKYKPYNKACKDIIYSEPKWMIYWGDNGKEVFTFKKNNKWYLNGIGGRPFFEREGITWCLRADRIYARFLPAGYILDSGSPIACVKEGVERDELFFILGWLLSNKATELLKRIINHTKNIQSKDIERLPYPFWVSQENKMKIIDLTKKSVEEKMNTGHCNENLIEELDREFSVDLDKMVKKEETKKSDILDVLFQ